MAADGAKYTRDTLLAVQVVLPGNFEAGIPDNRVSLNAGFDRHPTSFVSLARPRFVLSLRL